MQSAGRGGCSRWWRRFVPVLLLIGCVGFAPKLLAQPANDHFTNATVLVGNVGTVLGTTTGATQEPGEPNHWPFAITTNSVWFEWTAQADGLTVFDTDGSPSSSDTVLAVYTGTNLTGLTLIDNDDDGGSTVFASRVAFNSAAGVTYRIAVDGWNGANGPFRLNWTAPTNFVPPVTNEFQFSAQFYSTYENTPGFAVITVTYGGGAPGDVTVDYATADGTASAGVDYLSVSNTFVFAPGESNKSFTVPILDNAVQNSNKTVLLVLSNPTGGAQLGTVSNAVLTILDDETPPFVSAAGEFNFSASFYTVTENESAPAPFNAADNSWMPRFARGAIITVTRTAPAEGRVLVDAIVLANTNRIGTNNLSATPFVEFTPVTNTLVFDDYQMSASFLVPVFSDRLANGHKWIDLQLANPRPDPLEDPVKIAPTLGAGAQAAIRVLEINHASTTLNIERAAYRVDEYGGTVTVDITRPIVPGATPADTFGFRILNAYGFILQAASDYTDQNVRNLPNTLYTDGASNIVNTPDYLEPFDRSVFIPANRGRVTVTIGITNDSVVEFNEDMRIEIYAIPNVTQDLIGPNNLATATILYDDQPAGQADREWNPEGISATQPPFNATPGANNTVSAVAIQPDNRAVIVGDFTAVNSVSRFRVARMHPDGSLDLSFNPGSGANGFVEAVVIYPTNAVIGTNAGKILVAGGFSSFNNVNRYGIARLHPNGSLDLSFNPGNGADGVVYSLSLQSDGKVIVAGDFMHWNDVPVAGIMRLNQDGSLDTTFNPGLGANAPVWSVAVRDTAGTIFVSRDAAGTEFEDVNVIETGANEGTLTVDYDFLTIEDNIRVYYDGQRIFNLTTNGVGQLVIPYGPGMSSSITIVLNEGTGIPGTAWFYRAFVTPVVNQRTIYLGGEFTEFNGVTRNGVARLLDDGSLDLAFDPGLGMDGPVYAVAVQPDNKLLVGGAFSRFHTSERNNIVRLLNTGALDEDYNVGTGFNDSVYVITLQPDNKALVGGAFRRYNDTRRVTMARLFTDGSLDTSFMDTAYNQFAGFPRTYSFDPPRFVQAIALQEDGNLIVGGSFTNVGGNFSIQHSLRNNYTVFTRADKTTRFNVARILGGYTPGPGNIEFDPRAMPFTIDENAGVFYATMRRVDGRLGTSQVIGTNLSNTADFPDDFFARSAQLTWPEFAYVAPRSVGFVGLEYLAIPITDDLLQEGDETLGVRSVLPTGSITLGGEYVPLGTALGHHDASSVTISDNDFSHGEFNFRLSEYFTNENARFATISVTRTNGSSGAASVDYLVLPGTANPATPGADYVAGRGTLSFASGQTARTFQVQINDDENVEFDETISLVLTNAKGGATLPGGTPTSVARSTLRIIDNDFIYGRLNFGADYFTNNENEVFATVTVTRSGGSVGAMGVRVRTSHGTAGTADYTGVTNVLMWDDGDVSTRTVTIPLVSDGIVEGNETVNLMLDSPTIFGAIGGRSNAVLVIADGDAYGALSFNQPFYVAQENGTSPTITVQRSGGVAGTVSVQYSTAPLTAISGVDYNDTSGTLTFLPGESSKTFVVPLLDDGTPDGDQTVQLTLSSPVNATLGAFTSVVLSIIDNESFNVPAGSLDTTFSESSRANAAVYALALQSDGRLIMAGDFTLVNDVPRNRLARLKPSGVLDNSFDIGPGADDSIRALALQRDGKLLIGGLFSMVSTTNRSGIARLASDGSLDAFFNPGSGADNPVYAIAIQADDKILVGGSFSTFNGISRPGLVRLNTNGTVDLNFNVGAGVDGTVFAIALQPDGKILVGGDFTSFNGLARTNLVRLNANGSLDPTFNVSFGRDAAVRALAVQANGRILIGGSFTNVNGVSRAHVARLMPTGVVDGTFLNGLSGADDTVFALQLQIDGRIIVAGEFRKFNTVTRNAVTRLNADGSTDTTINFGNGANAFVAALVLQPDARIVIGGGFTQYNDKPRQYIARIYGGSIAGAGSLEFGAPTFIVSETSTNAAIVVRRRGGTTGEVRVDAFTRDGSAVAGRDYLAASNTLIFPPGETRGVLNVPIVQDSILNGNRTVQLGLANFVNAEVGPQPVSTLVIQDDESSVAFSVANFSVNENAVSGNATITVLRNGATNTTVTVDVATGGGTATPGVDYFTTNRTLVFGPGETTRLFNIAVVNDTAIEGNETIGLTLSNPSGNTTVGLGTATLTLVDDDFQQGQFVFLTNNFGADESAGAVTVTILRTNGTTGIVSVRLTTSNLTATAFTDYVPTNRVITFADGEAMKTINIGLINDGTAEPDETILLTLSQPAGGAAILMTNAIVTIFDDEIVPSYVGFETNNFYVNEFDGFATISVVRTNSRRGPFTIDFHVSNGSALDGQDYFRTNGTLAFADGENVKTFTIPIVNDTEGEGTETVRLTLSNLQSGFTAFLSLPTSTLNILDDDTTLRFSATNYVVFENAGAAVITVERVGVTNTAVSVDYATTTGGTAVAGLDYTPVRGTLNWAANDGAPKTFLVPLIDNNVLNQPKTVFLILSNAVGTAAYVTAPTNAVLTILDDETVPPAAGPVDPLFNANFGAVGTVRSISYDASQRLYVGGDFTQFHGLFVNRITRLTTNGAVDINFNVGPGADAIVYSVAALSNRVYVGGAFTNINGVPRSRIARLLETGAVDPAFSPTNGAADGPVHAVAVAPNQAVYIGGEFLNYDGNPARRLARLNPDASFDATFNIGNGIDGTVRAIAVQPNGQVIIGGDFSAVNSFLISRLARLNLDGTLDTTFSIGLGADGAVNSIAIGPDGRIVIGGDFFTINGVPRNGVARLNADGSVDTSFNIGDGANAPVRAVAIETDGHVLAAGAFTTFNGNALRGVARLNDNGGLDNGFTPGTGADAPVHAISLVPRTVPPTIATMNFDVLLPNSQAYSNHTENFLTLLNTTGGVFFAVSNPPYGTGAFIDSANPVELRLSGYTFGLQSMYFTNLTAPVTVTASTGGSVLILANGTTVFPAAFLGATWVRIVPSGIAVIDNITVVPGADAFLTPSFAIGGDFETFNGVPRGGVAVLTTGGTAYRPFDPRNISTRSVFATAIHTNLTQANLIGKIIVGGDFTAIVGVDGINRLARLSIDGTLDTSFNTGLGLNAPVRAVAVQPDGKVLFGGFFTTYDLLTRAYLGRANVDGTLDNTFNFGAGLDNAVLAMALQGDGKVVVGGQFTSVYGTSRNGIARVHTNGTVDVTFNPGTGANGPVRAVALQPDGKVLIGGDFTLVNGVARFRIARLNTNGTVDATFNPGAGADGSVNAIALTSSGGVLIGGAFTNVNGVAARRVALLTSGGALDGSFNTGSGANDYVTSIQVQGDGRIVVGGNFTMFNGQVRNRIVRLNSNGSFDPTINFGTGANDVINTVSLQNYDGKIVIGGSFTEVDGLTRVAIARLFAGTNFGSGTFRFSAPAFTVNENVGTGVVTVVRGGGLQGTATVQFSTANGTATSPADYTAVSGTLVFNEAENVKFINVPIRNDSAVNGDRTFNVSLFNPSPGTSVSAPSNAVVTIVDDDSVIDFSSPAYLVNENALVARISVTRTGSATFPASVDFATETNGTATAGLDFTPRSGTLLFAPGVRVQSFDVPILDDTLNEFDETVPLTLGNVMGASLGLSSATLTIVENDFAAGVVTFGTNSYFVSEDALFLSIEVLRTNGHTGPVSVNYQTVATGTATPGVDYVATNGVVNFAEGQTNAFIVLRILDDITSEGIDTFNLQLFGPSGGATLGLADATVTIIDNDQPGKFVFSAPTYTVSESNAFLTVTVLRTNGNRGAASVRVQTSGGTATPTVDYGPISTVLAFTDGQSVRTFNIAIAQDAVVEGTETIGLLLSNPTDGTSIGVPGTATVFLIDDEVAVGFSAANYAVNEDLTNVTITLVRTGDTNNGFSVTLNTSDGTAVAGQDYVPNTTTATFAPGQMTQTVMVAIFEDQLAEGNEFLNLTLSSPSGGVTLGPIATATLTILDDDTDFVFSSANYSTNEANVDLVITVLRVGFVGGTGAVDYATFDGTATTSLDYLQATGRLAFVAGQTSAAFTVRILDDTLVEGNETINLVLGSPVGGFIGPQGTAVITILDNDTSVGFSRTNYIVNEKATNAAITLVRNGAAQQPVQVSFRTINGTAVAGVDYGAVSNQVVWAANDIAPKTVLVPVFDDAVAEGAETVTLQLLNPVNASIDPATGLGTLTIVDNAGVIAFASANYSVIEGSGNALLNLVRTGGSNGIVSVQWNVTGGTATPGEDYFGSAGTVVFAHGETTKPIVLPIGEDGLAEGVETIALMLSNADGGARVGTPNSARLSIIDNDTGIIVGAGSALIYESYVPTNNIIEPGETVTLLFALRNAGVVNADNVTAFLVYSNGVTHTNVQVQNYGALIAGGNSVSRPFTFTAQGTNGSRITATLLITNNGLFLGPVSFDFVLGRQNIPFQNATPITINDFTNATPYPAQLTVSGVSGPLSGLTVTLHGLSHNYPDDLDILLVGPNGTAVMLMSDAGGGLSNALSNVTFTFDDGAAQVIPDATRITNNLSYRCANYFTLTDPFPGFPNNTVWNNTSLSSFNGISPNGVWSLYIVDDATGQSGMIANGWSLNIQTADPVIPGADLSVTLKDAPDPVAPGGTVTYTIAVTNHGPAAANSVMLTNIMPPEANFISASGPFSYTQNGNMLFGSLGNIPMGGGVVVNVTMTAPNFATLLTFDSTVGSGAQDLNPGNDHVSVKTSVNTAPAAMPALFAAAKNGQLVLSWQGDATNIVLETTGAIGGGWGNSGMAPTVSNGVSTVTVPFSGSTKFFRLKRL